MANFSMNLKGIDAVSTVQHALPGGEIYEVTLDSVKFTKVPNKENESNPHQTLKIRFSNAEGYFEETIWAPKEGDLERKTSKNGKPMASNFETFCLKLAHFGTQLSPKGYEKFIGKSFDLPEKFEEMCNYFEKIMAPAIGKTTHIKLSTRRVKNSFYGCLPFFTRIDDTNKAIVSSNFLGDNLAFSSYELDQIKAVRNSAPTNMGSIKSDETASASDVNAVEEDLDFDL